MVAFVGAKGGVGTSMVAQTSAFGFFSRSWTKTVIMDAAGGGSYLSVAGRWETEAVTTCMKHRVYQDLVIRIHFAGWLLKLVIIFSILATGAGSVLDVPVSHDQFELILNKLMVTFPLVVIWFITGT